MSYKKLLTKVYMLLMLTSFFSGCEQVNNSASQEKFQKTPSLAGKPGAPIQLKHNYDGTSFIGEPEIISLDFMAGVSGELSIEISSKDNLITEGDITVNQVVGANEVITVTLTVSPPSEGKYYLAINTSITTNNSTQSRSFALAVSTPQEKQLKSNSEKPKNTTIIMDATETIRKE